MPSTETTHTASDGDSPAPLRLRKNEERRLRAGHLWVFSNEVDIGKTPLTDFAPGQPVRVLASNGKTMGTGYVNPRSLICARLVSRGERVLDAQLLEKRLRSALALRERCFSEPFYRLVFGESDGLPGLVVDRFDDVLVVQCSTAGMERVRDEMIGVLDAVLSPAGILLKNDARVRTLEGLPQYVETVLGNVPDEVPVRENGVQFLAPLAQGQKTGWYFDHRQNRADLARLVSGARVLDLFAYVGAWGVQAAVAGAKQVVCVDSSAQALDYVQKNATLNGVDERVGIQKGDAFEVLKELCAARERFDIVVLDPPAFIKRKKDLKKGIEAYRRLNQQAMRLLGADGLLLSASCSYHLSRDNLRSAVLQGARGLGREFQIIAQGHQGIDHPVHPAITETEYLKTMLCRVYET